MSRLVTYSVVGLMSLFGGLALAQSPEPIQVDIGAQPVGDALNQFAEQSGLQVVLYADDAKGIDVAGVSGEFDDASVALDSLLASTGLEYSFINDRTVAVASVQKVAEEGGDSDPGNGRTAGATPRPVMMTQAAVEQSQTSRRTETDSDEDEKKRPIEEIIVTGTNIRGIAPDSSPVKIFTREDIQISGAATAQDFIQTLPSNFGGGSNADLPSGQPGDTNSGFNSGARGSLGSSVNLRGLGSGSTLVLLNGHRLAPSSGIGDFVDISMIPASAIERVDVLTDGASSIYGADAVAGVVNFILREDYDGVEVSLRYGTVTEGDLDEYRASLTGGRTWDSGNALVVYEYFQQDELSAADRSFSQGALLPNVLLPSQERHSVLASAKQELSPSLEIFGDIVFSSRNAVRDETVVLSEGIGSSRRSTPSSRNLNVSTGGSWKVSDNWYVDLSGVYSDLHSEPQISGGVTDHQSIDSSIRTIDAKASGSALSLPGGDAKLAIGGHYRAEEFSNADVVKDQVDLDSDREVYAFFGEAFIPLVGADNAVPGIQRLEVNASARYEDYSDFGSTTTPKVGVLWSPLDGLRLRGSYSRSFNPPPLGRVNAPDLVGAVFSSSFLSEPSITDVGVIHVFGTAKDLDAERSRAYTVGFDFDKLWGRHEFTLSGTWFDIEYTNRLGSTPVPGGGFNAVNIASDNPELLPPGTVVLSPSQNEIDELIDSLDLFLVNTTLDPEIINFAFVVRNLALMNIRGVDLDAAYTFRSEIGDFSFGLDGTILQDFRQQAAVTTEPIELLDTLFSPLNLRLRGRAGYSHNGISANLFVNYADDYQVSTAGSVPIDSWTTIDFTVAYSMGERSSYSLSSNTQIRLSALNLFNQDPPKTPGSPGFGIFGYDAANASPLGRFIALELTKRF